MSIIQQRLVVVSNRLPIRAMTTNGTTHFERAPGGLVSALDLALRKTGGTWVGWPGGPTRDPRTLDDHGRSSGYRLVPIDLSTSEVRQYYLGFANRTIWPLLHSFPGRLELDRDEWTAYEKVNRRFAHATAETAEDGDLVWIHDYQLMRLALFLRATRPCLRIAFFLHVPFPPVDLFRILPWDRDLLQGLLACDLVGFHCSRYVTNFLDCAEQLLGARVDRVGGKVEHGERTVSVTALPIGIDYERFHELAEAANQEVEKPHRIVLGVDRLDYTKGLPEKIRAFERLLETHPEYRESVILLQIAELSRDQVPEYRRLKRRVDELVGHVNGRFATSRWTPIQYIHGSESPESLAGLYRQADVLLVTALRDGMNLVAKEFVACQSEEPGVLVLSRLAGAAESMQEALLVNPYNVDAVAESLHAAFDMDLAERTERMRALQQRVRRFDVHDWTARFIERACAPIVPMRPLRREDFSAWLGSASEGQRLALFLDFDGTLAEIADHPADVRMSESVWSKLSDCADREDTDVAIVTGRALDDIRSIGAPKEVILVANHGFEMEGRGLPPFRHPELEHHHEALQKAAHALRDDPTPGCWVEEKGASITYHYRNASNADQTAATARAREVAHDHGLHARAALCAVELRMPIDWGKGDAVLHVLRSKHGRSWAENVEAIYAGDDETDEDAFRALQGLGVTFRVGRAELPTSAMHRLPNVDAVEALLDWVANR
jgi:trehalose 6-phosphate synthase/phosphatase